MSVKLHLGDCLDVLPTLETNSIETIITDPPYGLEFMGKDWDHGIPGAHYWAECLRVAKPGAMLCAFGGTRTHHRLMCAIEDAGWEIRDVLMWVYGSGFPKSHDVSKAIDRRRNDDLYHVTRFIATKRDAAGLTNSDIDRHFGFHGMAGHWTSQKSQPSIPTWEQWQQLKTFVGFNGEMDAEVWRLNGRKGKPGDAWAEREVIGRAISQGGRSGSTSSVGQHLIDAGKEYDITSPATPPAQLWDGWGTALKPAYEPIILAMKPLPGTFAQNALEYGVAGVWVDGCRIGTGHDRTNGGPSGSHQNASGEWGLQYGTPRPNGGRWPANLLLSHAPGCECVGVRKVKGAQETPQTGQRAMAGWGMRGNGTKPGYASPDGTETIGDWRCVEGCPVRMLDEQSGELKSGGGIKNPVGRDGLGWKCSSNWKDSGHYAPNTGGASRFFTRFHYSAKASRTERELGLLGHIPCLKCGGLDTLTHINPKTGKEEKCRRNGHPTVKPLDVCRWLCRLTKTPTGGVVLDPFMGSGRIPMAAILEGRDTIGIELERPSFDIAEAAVRWAQEQIPEMVQGEFQCVI
jgi:DNA modification methylase